MEKRALGLDALRGFAILTMILSGRVPFGVLPNWMYHIQVPPPHHKFDPSMPGISWVDLVFPFFLFAMGAAFPFALSKRSEAGYPKWKLILETLKRGFLLTFFAVVIQHIRPHVLDPAQGTLACIYGLLTFGLLFLIFFRYPNTMDSKLVAGLKAIGYIGIVIFLWAITYPNEKMPDFSLRRFDIIILVLANMAVFGSIIWLFTQKNVLLRLGIIALLFAIRLSNGMDGSWVNQINVSYGKLSAISDAFILFNFNFLKYLFIILPGTIAGEIILDWIKSKDEIVRSKEDNKKYISIALTMFLIIIFLLVTLYNRYITLSVITVFVVCLLVYWGLRGAKDSFGIMLKRLFEWGFFWLLLGLLMEPFEGGIKKDHSTMSYYFATSGMAIMMIIGFNILIDYFKKKRWVNILIENGQNPMLAYAGGTNLLTPVVTLLYIDYGLSLFLNTPWLGALKGFLLTLLLALIVSYFTKKKIYWRS